MTKLAAHSLHFCLQSTYLETRSLMRNSVVWAGLVRLFWVAFCSYGWLVVLFVFWLFGVMFVFVFFWGGGEGGRSKPFPFDYLKHKCSAYLKVHRFYYPSYCGLVYVKKGSTRSRQMKYCLQNYNSTFIRTRNYKWH